MYSYCVIPAQDHCKEFFTFVDHLQASVHEKELFRSSKIEKVEVDTVKGGWEVLLSVKQTLPGELIQQAQSYLASHCGLKYVKIIAVSGSFADYLKVNWQNFIEQVVKQDSGLKHLLIKAKWTCSVETLAIEIFGQTAVYMLEKYGIAQRMEQLIFKQFGHKIVVDFICLEETAPVAAGNDDYMTAEYLEALEEHLTEQHDKVQESPVIFGKNFRDEPVPIHTIQEEQRHIVFEGVLVQFELKELRSGRFLLTFDLSDETDGISGKAFFDNKEQYDKVSIALKKGMMIRVKGTVQYDKYALELVMFADSICRGQVKAQRKDEAKNKRIELHAHTKMSTLDGVATTKSLIQTAADWGHTAIAITDHGVVQAFPEAQDVAEKAGIKIIYGMEGYLCEEDITKSHHVIILAKNLMGLRNLYRIVSLSHLKYLYRRPRVPRQILVEHREGLIIGSACEAGELIRAIVAGASEEDLLKIAAFYDYLEIQPILNNEFLVRQGLVSDDEGLRQINKTVYKLGEMLGKKVVATGDVHFLHPEDALYREILMSGQGFRDANQQPPLYLHTTDEMLAEFDYLGKEKAYEVVVTNPQFISDMVEHLKPIPDELYSPQIPGAEEAIESMSYSKAKALYGDPLPEIVAQRLKTELDSIINHGFAVLYLIAHKLVKKSLDDGYLVGSRGSVGSSFVAHMTDITEVNSLPPHYLCPICKHSEFITDGSYGSGFDLPDKDCPHCLKPMVKNGHDIPFAVFMGFHGDKVPDIDLNFSGDYQPVAHKYTEELFGKDNVFRAGTIATIADKTAYGFVKNYFNDRGETVRNARINHLIAGCTGVKRTTGQHPGGIMVIPRDMDVHHFTPIQYPADDKKSLTITTHFDYHSISSRLVKLDILGHDDPTVIRMLEDLTGIDAKTIPFDDAETMSLFSSTEALKVKSSDLGSTVGTYGIPEFGTKFVRQMLDDTKPQKFSELVRISGFSHGTDVWLNNAQELIRSGTAQVSETISARDDIMMYLIHKGVDPSDSFKIMESVRKGKGVKPDAVEKMQAKQVPAWYIESCQKIKYMFPRAHAVAYVMMAYRIAYCKVHYPLAYYASYFTVRAAEFDAELVASGLVAVRKKLNEFEQKGNTLSVKEKSMQTILEIVLEMYLRGFKVHKVDLYHSAASKFTITEDGLLPPLAGLQGLGTNAAINIVKARTERVFSSIEDLRNRSHISKTIIEILREHGCLEGMSETDQMMLFA
jgi:DNA polymerase III subunit alpha, Gram-positive type